MEHQSAENAAFTMMSEASHGQDISRRYNSLTSDEQKQVFTEMKSLQMSPDTSKLFGNIDLFDSNHDGRMDDVQWTGKNGNTRDVYNTDSRASNNSMGQPLERAGGERPADEIAQQSRQSDNVQNESRYGQNRYGENRYGQNRNYGHDRSADEIARNPEPIDRLGKATDNAMRRAGEIVLDESIRGLNRHGGHGPSVGERIEKRMERDSVQGANRALRNILRGR